MMQSESTVSDSTTPTSNATAGAAKESPDAKVGKDLATLEEQIELCQSMLATESDIDSNEALLAVIGFLEACVPRMVELIEAGTQGALGEDTLERCLVLNDRLCRTLEDCDEDDPAKRSSSGASAAAAAATAAADAGGSGATTAAKALTDTEKEFDDLLGSSDSPPPSPKQQPAAGGKSTGEEAGGTAPVDPFAGEPDVLTPTPAGSTPVAEGGAVAVSAAGSDAKKDDFDAEFDAFLKERSSGDNNGD